MQMHVKQKHLIPMEEDRSPSHAYLKDTEYLTLDLGSWIQMNSPSATGVTISSLVP